MEVRQQNAFFAINKIAAEASQAACCRSTMGPKMAAKLEADNDSGPHTTEAEYEEQDVRKLFAQSSTGRRIEMTAEQKEQSQLNRNERLTSCNKQMQLRENLAASRFKCSLWQVSPLVTVLLTTLLILFSRQISAKSQLKSDDVILSTAFNGAQQVGPKLEQQSLPDESHRAGNPNRLAIVGHDNNQQQFKYHLNHLRPPSLVPITIVQQQQHSSGLAGALVADQAMAASTNVDWSELAAGNPYWLKNSRVSLQPSEAAQAHYENLLAATNQPRQASSVNNSSNQLSELAEPDRLVQLQLPLQLHLKLRPLPLPMPPPSERLLPIPDPAAPETKRKRSLEPAATTTTTTTMPPPTTSRASPTTTTTTTTTGAPKPAARTSESSASDRRDLMALTWREAKRILLLSSMSPALVQAKLDRRFADAPNAKKPASEPDRFGESATPGAGNKWLVGERSIKRRTLAESTTTTSATSSALASSADQQQVRQQQQPQLSQTGTTLNGPPELLGRLAKSTPQPDTTTRSTPTETTATITTTNSGQQTPTTTMADWPKNDSSSSAAEGEVRRQRHSSQQQGHRNQSLEKVSPQAAEAQLTGSLSAADSDRIQALAAAMLPFFWPSFQLSGNGPFRHGSQVHSTSRPWPPTGARLGEEEPIAQLAAPSNRLSASSTFYNATTNSAMAASVLAPTIISLDEAELAHGPLPAGEVADNEATKRADWTTIPETVTTTTTSTTTTTQPAREKADETADKASYLSNLKRRHRKPSYLLQTTSSASTGSTPYPDSTRLASKYPLPKIKFQPRETTVAPPSAVDGELPASQRGRLSRKLESDQQQEARLGSKLAEGKLQHIQVPKSLSKLIEHQLLVNATGVLMEHKNRSLASGKSGGLPPTTSISKVVRLRNETDFQIVMSTVSSSVNSKSSQFPNDLQRYSSSSYQRTAAPTTTMAPTTTTTTSTTPATTTIKSLLPATSESAPETTESWSAPSVGAESDDLTTANNDAERKFKLAARRQTVSGRSEPRQLKTSTEPSGPYKSLPSPAQVVADSQPASSSPRAISVQDEMIGSNKVLPEEEESSTMKPTTTTTTTSTTSRPQAAGLAPKKYGLSGRQENGAGSKFHHSGQQHKNIKLFHFKRKPDMNKLPFYKKPLNYTELGWTNEQIQEHLESIGFAPASGNLEAGGSPALPGKQQAAQSGELGGADESQLLKRKRRGKNQFERLMAELHGANQAAINDDQSDSGKPSSGPAPGSGESAGETDEQNRAQTDLVPVMKKKSEPLVMKPMFFVMNQKRRNPASSAPEGSSGPQQQAGEIVEPNQLDGSNGKAQNKSKPIIRMRRKHNGNQPTHKLARLPIFELLGQQQAAPWRPSQPFWSSASSAPAADKLLLVPSGLLTPSGSHLVPLLSQNYGPALRLAPANSAASNSFAWQPAPAQPSASSMTPSSPWQAQLAPGTSSKLKPKPSGGLAPNGEESFLVAPRGSPAASRAEPSAGEHSSALLMAASSTGLPQRPVERPVAAAEANWQPQAAPAPTVAPAGELRVPKLLKKPMRPAKYSLNGYIPKPSLGQQQAAAPATPQQVTSSAQATANKLKPKMRLSSATGNNNNSSGGVPLQNKDLDSSTSNEIFSRRRGLQQQHRSQPTLDNPHGAQQVQQDGSPAMSASQRQVEQSKRKYIAQQQEAVSMPALSVQKANIIKAKLGLIVNTQSSSTNKQQQQQQAASTNNILTADPNAPPTSLANDQKGDLASQNLLIGAPLNSIPKTDFECTDQKGKFVSGLFADHKTGCQVWHLCSNNRKYSFLCPSGTIFNAKLRICDWRYNVKCDTSLPF